jgi:two-component system KDP operon response regulator KdpE
LIQPQKPLVRRGDPLRWWQDCFKTDALLVFQILRSRIIPQKDFSIFLASTMTIIIIEDEKDLGILMRNFLEKQLSSITPSTIKLFTTLSEGLLCIRELNPDWVFIDNNLPDGRGINEIEGIKERDTQGIGTKIVMMSAMTNLREEAFKRGADYFLDKPISFMEVQNILASLRK